MEKDEAIEVAEKLSNVNNENYYVVKCCIGGYAILDEKKFKKAKKESYHKAIPSL